MQSAFAGLVLGLSPRQQYKKHKEGKLCHVMSQKCDEFEFSRIMNSCGFLARGELVVSLKASLHQTVILNVISDNGEDEVLCRVTEV
jgi:hypothetical protein